MATLHLHVGGLLALLRRGGRAAAAHDRGVRHVVGREDVAVGGRRRLGLAPVQRRGLLRHPDAGGVSAQPRPQPRPRPAPQLVGEVGGARTRRVGGGIRGLRQSGVSIISTVTTSLPGSRCSPARCCPRRPAAACRGWCRGSGPRSGCGAAGPAGTARTCWRL